MVDKYFDIVLVNVGWSKKYIQGLVNSVIQCVLLLVFDIVEVKKYVICNWVNGELFYGCCGILIYFLLQEVMCELEGGVGCVFFFCGVVVVVNIILVFVE